MVIAALLLVYLGIGIAGATKTQLPAFLSDWSDVVLNAVIERSSDGGSELHLVVMMLGHKAFAYMPQSPILMMNRSTLGTWGRVAGSFHKIRLPEATDCSFSGGVTSPGIFVPSGTSIDTGFNRNIELLRCAIPTQPQPQPQQLDVALVRRGVSVLSFSVSMRKRQTGFGFALSRKSSRLNLWQKGPPANVSSAYLCSSVIRPLEPTRPDVALPLLLEFVEHNVQIGFAHPFIATFLDPRSTEFQSMLAVLQPYIQARQVSLTCLALRGVDDYSGALGLIFIDDYSRYIHQNQCLYLTRGLASHLVMLHASEFLALDQRFDRISQLLQALPPPLSLKGGSFPCFYKLYTYGVGDPKPDGPVLDARSQFVADHYNKSQPFGPLPAFNVAVLPVRNVHSVAWHDAATCSGPNRVISAAVTANDALFAPSDYAAVYFYRQATFDPWQLKRQHFPPSANNHTARYGRSAELALLAKNIIARGNRQKLRFPALSSAASKSATGAGTRGVAMPRGRQHVIDNGMLECQPTKSCKYFNNLLGLP